MKYLLAKKQRKEKMNTYAANLLETKDLVFKGKTIELPIIWIIKSVYLYMTIPIAIFFWGHLLWYFAIIATIILATGLFFYFVLCLGCI